MNDALQSKRRSQRTLSFVIALVMLFSGVCGIFSQFIVIAADSTATARLLRDTADGIIKWKKGNAGLDDAVSSPLLSGTFLDLAGTTAGDWYPIGLSRLGISDDYDAYLAVLRENVRVRYGSSEKLSNTKATEWHRIILSVLAAGGDPTNMGKDKSGQTIDLISDGTYNRGKTVSLGKQGINGWIWGLIALDSMDYAVPDGAYNSRSDIIREILSRELTGGGFALIGTVADPDITAMAIQALAPYYNSELKYDYLRKSDGAALNTTVRVVVDRALDRLSALQTADGDFISWGTRNVESTCQVAVALCSLGIFPLSDERFIKNGKTLLDGIMKYRMSDGGFVHSFKYDPENPTSKPDKSNSMAGEQVLYTLAALLRCQSGMRALYDFLPELTEKQAARIAAADADIRALSEGGGITGSEVSAVAAITAVAKKIYSMPLCLRRYIKGYSLLQSAAAAVDTELEDIEKSTAIVYDPSGDETKAPDGTGSPEDTKIPDDTKTPAELPTEAPSDTGTGLTPDTQIPDAVREDVAAIRALPDIETIDTSYYAEVLRLISKLEDCEDFEGRDIYYAELLALKARIAEIKAKIASLNAGIRENLYPFESITRKDRALIESIIGEYEKLSEHDRALIENYEDVIRAKTKLDSARRAVIIAVSLSIVVITAVCVLTVRIRRRRAEKRFSDNY